MGFMGTGKTAVGKELAKIKKWQFIDLDELIELKTKRIIADIFAQDGESYFRRREKQVLKETSKKIAKWLGLDINTMSILKVSLRKERRARLWPRRFTTKLSIFI